MGLDKTTADKIAEALRHDFNQVTIRVVTALNTDYRVQVDHYGKATPEKTLKAIEARANELAGRTLTRAELEFKTGQIYF